MKAYLLWPLCAVLPSGLMLGLCWLIETAKWSATELLAALIVVSAIAACVAGLYFERTHK